MRNGHQICQVNYGLWAIRGVLGRRGAMVGLWGVQPGECWGEGRERKRCSGGGMWGKGCWLVIHGLIQRRWCMWGRAEGLARRRRWKSVICRLIKSPQDIFLQGQRLQREMCVQGHCLRSKAERMLKAKENVIPPASYPTCLEESHLPEMDVCVPWMD